MGVIPTEISVEVCSPSACPYSVVEAGSSFLVKGRLTYSIFPMVKLPMANAHVYIKLSGAVSGSYEVVTDKNGEYAISLVAPASGSITATAEYKGSVEFSGSKSSATATVMQKSSYLEFIAKKKGIGIMQYLILAGILAGVGVTLGALLSPSPIIIQSRGTQS